MKKYLVLTSMLALTACGGGSGGSGGGAISQIPDITDIPTKGDTILIGNTISDDVLKSNAHITGIALDNRAELVEAVEKTLGKTYQDEEMSTASYSLRAAPGMDNNKRWEWAKGKINTISWFDKSDVDLLTELNKYKEQGEAAYNQFINDLKDAFTLVGGDKDAFNKYLDGKNFENDNCAGLSEFITGMVQGNLKNDFEQAKKDMQYKEYDLSAVKFYRGNAHTTGEYIQFKLDSDGKINQMYISDVGTLTREDDNNFAFHYYKYEADDFEFIYATKITSDAELREALKRNNFDASVIKSASLKNVKESDVTSPADVTLFGSNTGLRYSDFGYVTLTDAQTSAKSHAAFAGGYDDKKIARADIAGTSDIVFTGTAVANVQLGDEKKLLAPATATLTFSPTSKTEKLQMSFTDWHDVQITRTGNNKAQFSFSNFTGDAGWNIQGTGVYKQQFDTTYYGPDGVPTESTAAFGYVEQDRDDELRFGGAFGGAK